MKGMLWALLAALAVACGGGDTKPANQPAAKAADQPAPTEKVASKPADAKAEPATGPLTDADFPVVLTLFDAITAAVVDHAGDCDGMAEALEKVVVVHATTIARLRLSKEDQALNQRFLDAHGARVQQGQTRMASALLSCQSNARVMKVFTEAF